MHDAADLMAASAAARDLALTRSGSSLPDLTRPEVARPWRRHLAHERAALALLRTELDPDTAAAEWRRLQREFRTGAREAATPGWRNQRSALCSLVLELRAQVRTLQATT